MNNRTLIDAGPLVALINSRDPNNERCVITHKVFQRILCCLVFIALLFVPLSGSIASVKKHMPRTICEAAYHGDIPRIRQLLSKGESVNRKEKDFVGLTTPLLSAVDGNQSATVLFLLKRGAKLNSVDATGETAIMIAISENNTTIVRELIEAGADINHEYDTIYETPLDLAAGEGHSQIVKLLLDKGAKVNLGKMQTPLINAVESGNINMVKLLLKAGANPVATGELMSDSPEFTPIGIAQKNGHLDIVALLRQAILSNKIAAVENSPSGNNEQMPIVSFSGETQQETDTFTIPAGHRGYVVWSASPGNVDGQSFSGNFSANLKKSSDNSDVQLVANVMGAHTGTTNCYHQGTFYFDVAADENWTIKVYVY